VSRAKRPAPSGPSVLSALELRIPPLALVAIFGVAMWCGARAAPSLFLAIPARLVVAAAMAALGGAVSLAGVLEFRGARTTVSPYRPDATSAIVRTGVYRYSRNPMYLGFLFMLGGWAVLLSNAFALALLPLFVVFMSRFQVVPEERWLMERFGDEFAEYMTKTRRWL